jgi:hypothetical protein
MTWALAGVVALLIAWLLAWVVGRRYPNPYKDIPPEELHRYENGAQL